MLNNSRRIDIYPLVISHCAIQSREIDACSSLLLCHVKGLLGKPKSIRLLLLMKLLKLLCLVELPFTKRDLFLKGGKFIKSPRINQGLEVVSMIFQSNLIKVFEDGEADIHM